MLTVKQEQFNHEPALHCDGLENDLDELELQTDEDVVDGGVLVDVLDKLACPMHGCHERFCHQKNPIQCIFEHTRLIHQFDFHFIQRQLKLDIYGCMKLVNYVREKAKRLQTVALEDTIVESSEWLSGDTYLKPVLQEDPLLFAFDDIEEDSLSGDSAKDMDTLCAKPIEELTLTELRQVLAFAEWKNNNHQERFNQLLNDFKQFKEVATRTLLNQHDMDAGAKQMMIEKQDGSASPSDAYFDGYSHDDIHETMLKDVPRTEAYRDFMYDNKHLFKDKVVMDVGCGTGILSMFAARAGARRVIAIDNSRIISAARNNIRENQLDHIIECIHGQVEDIKTLNVDSVDILVSEWMGYFLLFEGMLDSVLFARDKWLASDGFLAPSQSHLYIAAMDAQDILNDSYHYWNDVYGFKMSVMKTNFHQEAHVGPVSPSALISDACCVKKIDMNHDHAASLDFKTEFSLSVTKKAILSGFCGWFDVVFDGHGAHPITLSTACDQPLTHWQQTGFILKRGIHVQPGMTIKGSFSCNKGAENHRELVIDVDFQVFSQDNEKIDQGCQNFKISA